jgi:hypothetical protein
MGKGHVGVLSDSGVVDRLKARPRSRAHPSSVTTEESWAGITADLDEA